jgi:hypothetical protein
MTHFEEDKFIKEVEHSIISDPENALSNFKNKWNMLLFDSKCNIASFILKFCFATANSESIHPQRHINYDISKLCSNAIYRFIIDELSGKPDVGHLKLGKNTKPIDMAAIFKIIYETENLDNSLSEIASAMIRLFNLKDNTTIESYLEENSKLGLAAQDFYTKMKETKLIKNSTPPF